MTFKLKELMAKVLTSLIWTVESVTLPVSLSNQRYKSFTKDISKTGYVPIGIVGWNTQTVDWMMSQCFISGNTLHVYVFRNASATASVTFTFQILYRKVGG